LLISLVIAVLSIGFIRPPVPREWQSITVGLSQDEVVRRMPNKLNDLWELKGFDIAARKFKQWGFRDCW